MLKKWPLLLKNALKATLILLVTTGLSFLVDEFGFRVDTVLLYRHTKPCFRASFQCYLCFSF
jgi:hypothetical protein